MESGNGELGSELEPLGTRTAELEQFETAELFETGPSPKGPWGPIGPAFAYRCPNVSFIRNKVEAKS